MKIITGFQDGVDIAAIRAAHSLEISTGGKMPKGFLTISGPRPEYAAMYGAEEADSSDYSVRTALNVAAADVTFVFTVDPASRGTKAAERAAARYKKFCIVFLLRFASPLDRPSLWKDGQEVNAYQVAGWFQPFQTVNIGGNREAWLEARMEPVFADIFRVWKQSQEESR
jgi:hypothetical protein